MAQSVLDLIEEYLAQHGIPQEELLALSTKDCLDLMREAWVQICQQGADRAPARVREDGGGDMEDTVPCGPPDDCADFAKGFDDYVSKIMSLPAGAGARRETTAQRDARERGEKRFNARGCK
jgi:hypothetical protein